MRNYDHLRKLNLAKRKPLPYDAEVMKRHLADGLSYRQIGLLYGLAKNPNSAVTYCLKKLGLWQLHPPRLPLTKNELHRARRMYELGASTHCIAEYFKRSQGYIYKCLVLMGVVMRRHGRGHNVICKVKGCGQPTHKYFNKSLNVMVGYLCLTHTQEYRAKISRERNRRLKNIAPENFRKGTKWNKKPTDFSQTVSRAFAQNLLHLQQSKQNVVTERCAVRGCVFPATRGETLCVQHLLNKQQEYSPMLGSGGLCVEASTRFGMEETRGSRGK